MADTTYHIPVLLHETVDALAIKPDGIYLDGTAGGGGHSRAIASRLAGGRLIALDRDPDAVKEAGAALAGLPVTVMQSNFTEMDKVLSSALPPWTASFSTSAFPLISSTPARAVFRFTRTRRSTCA